MSAVVWRSFALSSFCSRSFYWLLLPAPLCLPLSTNRAASFFSNPLCPILSKKYPGSFFFSFIFPFHRLINRLTDDKTYMAWVAWWHSASHCRLLSSSSNPAFLCRLPSAPPYFFATSTSSIPPSLLLSLSASLWSFACCIMHFKRRGSAFLWKINEGCGAGLKGATDGNQQTNKETQADMSSY